MRWAIGAHARPVILLGACAWIGYARADLSLLRKADLATTARASDNGCSRLSKPVDDLKLPYPFELFLIGSDNDAICRESVSCDKHVVPTDRRARGLESGSKFSIHSVRRHVEGVDIDSCQNGFDLGRKAIRAFLEGAKAELGSDNDAGANRFFANISDAGEDPPLRVSDQIREDVGVEQVKAQRSITSGI